MLEWDDERAAQWGRPRRRAEIAKAENGRTKRHGRMCVNVCCDARAPVHESKGVAVSLGDVTNFPESQNNRWLRETLAFCSFLEIRLMFG